MQDKVVHDGRTLPLLVNTSSTWKLQPPPSFSHYWFSQLIYQHLVRFIHFVRLYITSTLDRSLTEIRVPTTYNFDYNLYLIASVRNLFIPAHIPNILSVDGYLPAPYLPILLFRSVCVAATLTRQFRKSTSQFHRDYAGSSAAKWRNNPKVQ